MSYLHYDIIQKQSSKKPGDPCGDYIAWERSNDALTIVLSDGLGSGVKANISAQMCATRILSLMRNGATMQEAFHIMAQSMNELWGEGHPFAVFSIARILSNGEATVLSYEIDPPVIIGSHSAVVLCDEVSTIGKAMVYKAHCTLKQNEGLMMVCDGITQAGLGAGLVNGWKIEGVARYITELIMTSETPLEDMPQEVHDRARLYWRKAKGDDCSVVMAQVRKGITVNLISGPPSEMEEDKLFVDSFMEMEGIKVVCGGTTSKVVARELGKVVEMQEDTQHALSPPKLKIEGISLVTEGIVTLNQVYNLLGEDTSEYTEESSVYELNNLLNNADKIIFHIGHASNPGIGNIQFRQQGILPRKTIIPIIIEKLRDAGKLVVLKEYT